MTEQRPRGGRLLKHRDFNLLWAGQTVSDLGSALSALILPLVAVIYLDATPFQVGVLAAAEWVPWLLIGLPAGVWVDRSRCRPVMLWCDVVRAVLLASVPIAAAFDALHLPQLIGVAFGTGVATVFFQVAYLSYLPALLGREDLLEANTKLQGSQAVAQIGGPGLGGLLTQLMRAPFALVVDAASYAVSAISLLAMQFREPKREPAPRDLRREIAEGARYVARDPLLRVLTIAPAVTNLFFTGVSSISVLFLVRSVHLDAGPVGVLMGVISLGSVFGAAVAGAVGRAIGTSRALWLVTLVTAPCGLLIPLTTKGAGLAFFVLGSVILLAGILIYNVNISSFRQAYCPPEILGRVISSMRFVLFGTIPMGALAAGALASAIGIREAMWILLAGNCLGGVILWASPLRTMRDLPLHPPGALLPDEAQAVPHT
ncbi:MAG TPA: MFS transporter [Jatrophihabitantaceae bacterium]|nr:MFS transporter [Jatrophihabitantaceae bacterium]